jgi:hypothetical protein
MKKITTTNSINDLKNSCRGIQGWFGIFFVEHFNIFFPCGFKDFYGVRIFKKRNVNHLKSTINGAKYLIMYSNFFTYYAQDMAKSTLVMNYYNNVYQG